MRFKSLMTSLVTMACLGLLLNFLMISFAYSEHEADHRYTLKGQLLDAQNKGIANADIKIMLDSKLLKQAKSDGDGNYKAKLHLHDPDYGKEIDIITPAGQGKVKVEFTLGDKETERFHIVNFVDGKLVDGNLVDTGQNSSSGQPAWLMIAAAVIVLLTIVILLGGGKKAKGKAKKK